MGNFTDYLKLTSDINYQDKQIEIIREVEREIDDDLKEKLASIDGIRKMVVFGHPECPDCTRVIGVLEALRKYIPSLDVDYRSRKYDKEFLLSINQDGRIPTIALFEGIKITLLINEFPKKLKEDMELNPFNSYELRKKFHEGKYDKYIVSDILKNFF